MWLEIVLSHGAVTLPMLGELVERWIEAEKYAH